jgi:hypothetical protein
MNAVNRLRWHLDTSSTIRNLGIALGRWRAFLLQTEESSRSIA